MEIFDKLFGKEKKSIGKFVEEALKGPTSGQIKISRYPDLVFALYNAYNRSPKVVNLVSSEMPGVCPECGTTYNSEWLANVFTTKTVMEASPTATISGMSRDTLRFLKGKCRNPKCNCKEILILWRPSRGAVKEALKKIKAKKVKKVSD